MGRGEVNLQPTTLNMASKESNHAPQEAAAEDHEINILSQSSDNEIFAQKILDVLRRLRGIDDQQLKEKGNIQGQNGSCLTIRTFTLFN